MQPSHGNPVQPRTAGYHLVKDRLDLVEAEIRSLMASEIRLVRDIATYLHTNGGKRLRPALVLLCARLCGYRGAADVDLGVIVEFIHTASLVHDDIVDGAQVRRGKQPANRIWGNQLAVLFGDFLYARSLAMSVAIGKLRVVEVLTHATSRLVEGEMLDVIHNGDGDLELQQYLDIIDRKTASLFAGCAQAAAVLADADPEREAALAGYGHDVGVAFQLVDDLLDYDADPERLGKEPGTDLREGKVTYPLIHLLHHGSQRQREATMRCLGDATATACGLAEIVAAMREVGSFEATLEVARQYAEQARTALSVFEPGEEREALAELPEFILARRH